MNATDTATENLQEKKGVEVIEIRFAVTDSENSVHKVFSRAKGRTLREAIEPICQLKCIDLESICVYLDSDRSAALPLDYDLYSLSGHALHVLDYKAPSLSTDEVDGKLFKVKKRTDKTVVLTPTTQRKSAVRVSSFAGRNNPAVSTTLPAKSKTPVVSRKSAPAKDKLILGEMYSQRMSTGSAPLARNTSAASMLSQPGGRRPRQSEVIPPMNMTSRLLGLSEGSQHKKEHSYEDDNGNERHKKQMSVPVDELQGAGGDVSPGGTLHKTKSSGAKLSMYSLQPQNSKSSSHASQHQAGTGGAVFSPQLLVSFLHAPTTEAASVRRRLQSHGDHNIKEKEKMEILADLLDQWQRSGLPAMPPLAGLPKFESSKFDIEDHWTCFIDKTDLTQRQKDQQEALWELLYTEAEYIRALYVIHELFICCLLNIQNDGVLNEIELDSMFSNVTELAITNSDFWSNDLTAVLEHSRRHKCLFNPSLLKPAFSNFGDKFMPYTRYCIEQKRCSDYVKKNYYELTMFKTFVVWAEAQKQCNRLKLHDLLVKPMQRMTRYGLLLRAIHKKTDEEDVKQDVMEMIKNVDKFVTAVDQTLTRTDEKEKLTLTAARIEPYEAMDTPLVDSECSKILSQTYMTLDLLSPMPGCGKQLRYNLMEGPLRLRDVSGKSDIYCILCTDMLLFTKPSKRDRLRIIKPPIRIDSLSIHEMKENPYLLLVHLTDFGVAQAAYTLHGDNIGKWAKTFKKAQTLYMKAKEQARKESESLSITDLELDDIGFSGPLLHKNSSDAVFTDFADPDLDTSPALCESPKGHSPTVKRISSFSSLAGTEGEGVETSDVHIPQSLSSPDIGRKHHTLPPNYKHPPLIKVHRKSSSSSGESGAVDGEQKSSGERRRRVGASHRHKTDKAAKGGADQTADSAPPDGPPSTDPSLTWQVGSSNGQMPYEDSDDEFAMSAQLNCDMRPGGAGASGRPGAIPHFGMAASQASSSSSLGQGHNGIVHSYSDPRLGGGGVHSDPRAAGGGVVSSSLAQDQSKSRKVSQMDKLRLKKFQDFLNDSSPGVEI